MTDDRSEEIVRLLAAARAEVKRLESELVRRGMADDDEQPDRYRSLFENSADAVLIIDGDTFIDCNRATVEMLRYHDKQQLLETHPSELSPPVQHDGCDSYEKANEMIRIALEKGSHRFEWDHRRADGEVFPVEVLLTPLPNSGGSKLHVVWRDITQRKELEAQLRQSQKMEAIGTLAGGIAHDFNNLLMIINGNTERLLQAGHATPETEDVIRQIGWAGQRAAELTAQLLASGRKQMLQPAVLDLNRVAGNAHGFLRRLIGADIELVTLPTDAEVNFKADPGLIEQVIINLATNARDSMPDGGVLTIEVSLDEIEEPASDDALRIPPGRYARLTVSDTGIGMDDEALVRAFDPFFTTKAMGKGSGLGLSMVHGIVHQSGGHIEIQSKIAGGTRVVTRFPTVDENPTDEPVDTDPPPGGNETILVAEDDESVAAIVTEMLSEAGYTVLAVPNGLGALDLFEEHGSEIDLVLTDVVMPIMGGPEFIRELQKRGQVPPVILASGYTDNLLGSLDELQSGAGFLQKPFDRPTLLRAVRTALGRHED